MNRKANAPVRGQKPRLKLSCHTKTMRELLTRRSFFGRQQRADIHLERVGQNDQFSVRHATKLRLNFRECCAAQIPSQNRTAGRKHFLCQSLLITQFSDLWSDNILWLGHAPKMELDTKTTPLLNCTDFGAT
jgi:hypothetical protein